MTTTIHMGDCRDVLPTLPERSVQMVVTSPPYYALRSYLRADDPNKAREIGAEPAPDCLAWARQEPPCGRCYVCTMRAVFGAAWRVLRDDGTCWLNLGDSYANDEKWGGATGGKHVDALHGATGIGRERRTTGMPSKSLMGIPWRVALALQADGWVLRSDVVWAKPNAMPESVQDRPTKAHEYLFLLAKQPRYFYDAAAVAEPSSETSGWAKQRAAGVNTWKYNDTPERIEQTGQRVESSTLGTPGTRNARTVWTIPTAPYSGAHFAVFPEALAERCVRAGSAAQACPTCGAAWVRVVEQSGIDNKDNEVGREYEVPGLTKGSSADRVRRLSGSTYQYVRQPTNTFAPACACPGNDGSARSVVLDPFGGSGTTGRVAERLGRDAVLIELNADYAALHDERLNGVQREMAL